MRLPIFILRGSKRQQFIFQYIEALCNWKHFMTSLLLKQMFSAFRLRLSYKMFPVIFFTVPKKKKVSRVRNSKKTKIQRFISSIICPFINDR